MNTRREATRAAPPAAPHLPATVDVLGCPVAATDYAGAVAAARALAESGAVHLVEAANTMVVTLARHDPVFGQAMAEFSLVVPDGMPLVWTINRALPAADRLSDRVYGPDLMLECFERTQDEGAPGHFLIGSTDETLERLTAALNQRAPGARILGAYSPPFGTWPEGENERICDMILESGAKLVWVGLGCPKQELWLAQMKPELPPAVYFGIGAAFALNSGAVRQAPAALQRLGMEWLFRLCMEPRRLFRRYIKFNSLFLYYLARDRGAQRATRG